MVKGWSGWPGRVNSLQVRLPRARSMVGTLCADMVGSGDAIGSNLELAEFG